MRKITVAILAFMLLISMASTAHARKGFLLQFFVNTGDEMFEAGQFTSDMLREHPNLADYQPTYMCQRFGFFGADIWTWDCHMVAGKIATESYVALPKDYAQRLQAQYPMSKAKRGFWNHYGIVSVIALVFGWNFITRKFAN